MPVRIGIVGTDVGAYSVAAFIKHRMPQSKILMISSGIEQHAFSSPWIRNDKKGRLAVMQLGRDILQMGESEFVISKVNSNIGLISDGGRIEKIPSFRSVVSNLGAIALEPFRRSKPETTDMSVKNFFETRFGNKFTKKYANTVSMCLTGQSAESVSIHSVLQRMASNFTNHHSVMLGPLWSMFSPQRSDSRQFTNVMDHLWQQLMSGGKYVSMSSRLDLSLFLERLETHVKEISGDFVSDKKVSKILEKGVEFDDGSMESVDLIISSERPSELVGLMVGDSSTPASRKFSQGKRMYKSRFEWSNVVKKIPVSTPVLINQESGEMIIVQSSLFDDPSHALVVDILSEKKYLDFNSFANINGKWLEIIGFKSLTDVAPTRIETCEEIVPSNSLGSNEALIEFNKMRKKSKTDIQVVGKWYYASSGSLTDIIADADNLASLIAKRYSRFPKVENELTADWMTRSDRSLDMSYQTEARHSTLLT
jgi:hypothetical protein